MKQGGMIEQLRNELVKSAGRDRAVIDALLEELSRLREERAQTMREVNVLDLSLIRTIRKVFRWESVSEHVYFVCEIFDQ